MKVCVVTHTFPLSPIDTTAAFMHPLVKGIIAAGNHVTVFTAFNPHLETNTFPYRIIMYRYIWPTSFHRLGYSQTLKAGTSMRLETYLLSPFLYISAIVSLFRLLRREHFDIVSAHWILPNGFIARVASTLLSIPYVISLPGSDVYIANKNFLFSWMARFAAGGTHLITADSPLYIKELKRTGAPLNKTHIIPYPVDIKKLTVSKRGIERIRKNYHIPKDYVILLAVGRLIYKKGFHILLSLLPWVVARHPRVRVLIAGDGDMRGQLEDQSRALGLAKVVTFIGNVNRDRIASVYNLADIFVMPSIRDNNGNIDDRPVALLEAMACGKAVIATNFAGNAQTVHHGINGILVTEGDPSMLGKSILALIKSKKLRQRLGRQAHLSVTKNFNYHRIGRIYNEAFNKLV